MGRKLRKWEKLLETSNFFFSPSVFKRLVLQTCKNQGLFGKGLTSRSANTFNMNKSKPFPEQEILESSNLKGSADKIINLMKAAESSPNENTVGKGDTAYYE